MELGFSKNLNHISGEFADVKLGNYRLERRLELISRCRVSRDPTILSRFRRRISSQRAEV